MTELLRSCENLAVEQFDDRVDLPQVHSLNILKALVVDARLAGSIRHHLSHITMLCIEGFTSPVWALRNASTQLFGWLRPLPHCFVSQPSLIFFHLNI